MSPSSILLPPPPPSPVSHRVRPRRSPRSVATTTSTPQSQTPKMLNFDDSEEDSFLAGFATSLRFPSDDDDWDPMIGNPFREAKAVAEATTPATPAATLITSSAAAATPTDYFSNYFESNGFSEERASSDYYASEATTAVKTNASSLLGPLLSNAKCVLASEQVTTSKVKTVTPENSPAKSSSSRKSLNASVKNWSRNTVKEELRRRSEELRHRSSSRGRSSSRAREDRRGRSSSSRPSYASEEDRTLQTLEESTLVDDAETYETNSMTLRDASTFFTEDSLTRYDDDVTFVSPIHYSGRSRRRGGRNFLCGCDDNDGMVVNVADTMNELKGAFKDLNRTMKQIVSPMTNARKYVIISKAESVRESLRQDGRPSRSRSRSLTRRSRSTSVRRERASSASKKRGRSGEPARDMRR